MRVILFAVAITTPLPVFSQEKQPPNAVSTTIPDDPNDTTANQPSLDNYSLKYTLIYENAPKGLLSKLKIISALEKKSRPLPTQVAIRRAARNDKTKFENALKAAGYYQGRVNFALNTQNRENLLITFTFNLGPLYTISDYKIVYTDQYEIARPTNFQALNLKTDQAADGASLLAQQQNFLNGLWNDGYPVAKIITRRAIADSNNATAVAEFEFTSGPKATFGTPIITGLTRIRENYITKLQNYEIGDTYNKSTIIAYRDKISQTNLFSDIDVRPAATQENGQTPILVNLTERKHRTIGAGLFFSTSEGPGGRVFFENRNLFKHAERFRAEIEFSQIQQSVAVSLDKPLNQLPGSVFLQGAFINQTTDAFDARTVNIASGVSKFWLNRQLETRGSLALETSSIEPANGDPQERTFFVSAPLAVNWNNEDDFLNPTKGVRASLLVTPYTGTDSFTQIEAAGRTRYAFGAQKRFIAAIKGRFGATVGSDLEELPLNKRFFSGGGSSVRGFGFQEAGPVEIQNDANGEIINVIPAGGRSAIEGAFEARYAITKTIQGAAFIDAGSISQNSIPDFNEDFFIGVGGGVRYLTPIGPLRVDIAVPLDRRPFDNRFQFLISLGQAF